MKFQYLKALKRRKTFFTCLYPTYYSIYLSFTYVKLSYRCLGILQLVQKLYKSQHCNVTIVSCCSCCMIFLAEENVPIFLGIPSNVTLFYPFFRLNADSEIAKKYGLIENGAYVLPTREDVIKHRVVITTLSMSKHLFNLKLNHGFFTHILMDEAAQALEPEALIPLALAGPNTKVVFTGDHMQVNSLSHLQLLFGLLRYYINKTKGKDGI